MSYDVIVVGAGPAGAVAAKTTAEKGLSTLLIERGEYPGQKSVGGEFLPVSIFEEFPWMRGGPLQRRINGWVFFLPSGDEATEIRYSRKMEYGYTVHRPEWDRWVGGFAESAGAELKTSTLVEGVIRDESGCARGVVTDKGERLYSKIVIGADGVNSVTARSLGLRKNLSLNSVALCAKYTYTLPPEKIEERFGGFYGSEIEILFGEEICPRGFAWIFPSERDFCIGIGCGLDAMEKNIFSYLQEVVTLPRVKDKVQDAKLMNYSTHLVPIYGAPEQTYGGGFLLVGDAAGFVCPFDGAGYEAAAMSGKMAGEVAAEAISLGDVSAKTLRGYEDKWMKSFIGKDITYGRKVQDYVVNKMGVDLFNRMIYEMGSAMTKHGSYTGKSHGEAVEEFLSRYAKTLAEMTVQLAPSGTVPLKEVAKLLLGIGRTTILSKKRDKTTPRKGDTPPADGVTHPKL
ncbi:MAG: NAD(P)/FAD-dependent oxidoreductase [Candidatus Bathyarchaeia archaeon]